jgi:HlyD family secretion protein
VVKFLLRSIAPEGPSQRAVTAGMVLAGVALISPLWAADPDTSLAPAVTVVQAKRDCFAETLDVTGVVVPRHTILVRPAREGLVIGQVLVQPGDAVISGQVLARLKQPDSSTPDVAVTAPDGGVIFSMSAVKGAIASASGEPLFNIAQNSEMELATETPVNTMSRLAVDQPVKVKVIGIDDELSGKVRFVANAINRTTQLGEVHLLLNADQRLRVGAFGRGKIEIGQRCRPAIPLSAVLYAQGGAVVQVVRDGHVETRVASVGLVKGDDVEVRDGIVEGEVVVARAGAFVRDGDRVRPVVATKPLPK